MVTWYGDKAGEGRSRSGGTGQRRTARTEDTMHATLARIQDGAKFPLGTLAMSSGLLPLVEAGLLNPVEYLARHARGDWGVYCVVGRKPNGSTISPCSTLFRPDN